MRYNILMICYHCNQLIKEPGEYCFMGHWSNGSKSSRTVRYHTSCFQEIAGKKFLDVIKKEGEVTGSLTQDFYKSFSMFPVDFNDL